MPARSEYMYLAHAWNWCVWETHVLCTYLSPCENEDSHVIIAVSILNVQVTMRKASHMYEVAVGLIDKA